MNIITIPDSHGRTVWKKVDPTEHDKIIFLGDYLDSYCHGGQHLGNNLKDIIEFKLKNMEKVELLLGNHDIHYMLMLEAFGTDLRSSGFNEQYSTMYFKIFEQHADLFKCAYQIKNYLWTHAGLSNKFYKEHLVPVIEHFDGATLADKLNQMFESKYGGLFAIGYLRGGRSSTGGPFWADRQETNNNSLTGYHQIVGHTVLERIATRKGKDENTSITYCDIGGHGDIPDHELHILDLED